MKIRRVRRLAVAEAHSYFAKNKEDWKKLNAGKVIEIPKEELNSIEMVFLGSIEVVKEIKEIVDKGGK